MGKLSYDWKAQVMKDVTNLLTAHDKKKRETYYLPTSSFIILIPSSRRNYSEYHLTRCGGHYTWILFRGDIWFIGIKSNTIITNDGYHPDSAPP